MSNEKYIKKWLESSLSEAEEKAFMASDEYQSLKKMSDALTAFKAPEYDIEAELVQLKAKRKPREAKVVALSWVNPFLKVAAVILVCAIGYYLFLNDPKTSIETLAGQKSELYLPDSSFVILNAGSKIAYTRGSWEEGRKLELKGEAYFKVKKGSKFEVETAAGTVRVLGTEFNVKHRDNYFDVICYEGLVEVQANDHKILLSASKGFRVVRGIAEEYSNKEISAPYWTGNQSYFKSVPFRQVVRELERQYGITIEMTGVDETQLFTGAFVHNDLALALKSTSLPLNLKYKILEGQRVVLSGDNE